MATARPLGMQAPCRTRAGPTRGEAEAALMVVPDLYGVPRPMTRRAAACRARDSLTRRRAGSLSLARGRSGDHEVGRRTAPVSKAGRGCHPATCIHWKDAGQYANRVERQEHGKNVEDGRHGVDRDRRTQNQHQCERQEYHAAPMPAAYLGAMAGAGLWSWQASCQSYRATSLAVRRELERPRRADHGCSLRLRSLLVNGGERPELN
jgi:hypothetical protein